MKTRILTGLNEQDASELKGQFIASSRLRKRLVEVLEGDIESLRADMARDEHFKSPNWNLIQADRIAQEKAIRKFISLIE